MLVLEGDQLCVYRSGHADALVRIDTRMGASLIREALLQAAQETASEDLHLLLCLPRGDVLRRRLLLPEAALERLNDVVAFEMDRQTPFRAADVYYDVREDSGRAPDGQVGVDLLVVPRARLEPLLQRLRTMGIAVDAVDAIDARDTATGLERAGFNLLPAERRPHRINRRRRLNLALAGAALLLLVAGMALWVHNREQALAHMQHHVAVLRTQAVKVAALRKQLTASNTAAGFLARKRATSPTVLAVLESVTRRLPDDTWLQRFTIDEDGHVGMQGQSPQASRLIDLLKASPLLQEPGFQGAIQTDPDTGKERFFMTAQVQAPGTDAGKEAAHASSSP